MTHPIDARALAKWRYGVCALTTESDRFGPFADLLALWHTRIPSGAAIPRRKDFDVFDFKPWLGRISIARMEADPFHVRFVLWGTRLTQWWGVDYTNKLLGSEATHPEAWQIMEFRYFQTMMADPFIGIVGGPLDQYDRPFINVAGVDLPMSGDDGGLSHVLSAYVEIEQTRELGNIVPNLPISRYF